MLPIEKYFPAIFAILAKKTHNMANSDKPAWILLETDRTKQKAKKDKRTQLHPALFLVEGEKIRKRRKEEKKADMS